MKPIPSESPRATQPPVNSAASSREYRPLERWLVRGLLILGVLVIAAGAWQTIGREAFFAARRLPIFRRVAPLPESDVSVSRSDAGVASSRPASSSLTGLPSTSRSFDERHPRDADRGPVVNAMARPGEPPAGLAAIIEQPNLNANGLDDKRPAPNEAALPVKPVANGAGAVPADLLQAAAQLVSLGWQDFDYPAKWFAAEASKPRMLYNSHRNRLLNAITHPRPSELSLAQLRKDYTVACEQFADDPRLDYAFGLALWHHGERSEALEFFQTAARLEQTPFLPAALAVGWGRLLNGEERRGLDQLSHVAKLLKTSSGPYPTQTQKEHAALCLGRAFGFLNGPGRTSELAETSELTARNVRDRLPSELLPVFEEGFNQVGQRESDLLQFASLPENTLTTEHRQQSEELQTRIDTLREEMQQTRQELARDHLSHLSKVTGFLSDAIKGRAESSTLQSLIEKFKGTITQLNQPKPHAAVRLPSGELVAADSGTSPTNGPPAAGSGPSSGGSPRSGSSSGPGFSSGSGSSGPGSNGFGPPQAGSAPGATTNPDGRSPRTNPNGQANNGRRQQIIMMPETPVERAARMAKLDQARGELKRIQDDLATLREQHKDLLDQRRQAESEKLAETKETRKRQADRIREQREFEKRLRELNTALRQTQGLRNSLDTIAAYVPWTIEVEGEALRLALTKKPEK
ncbi:MAG: hypothetical protein H7062_01060 [Candidatus Saccharimonas sp.]|nr:hypothetical protein [Planctomycetaceae bacterium]